MIYGIIILFYLVFLFLINRRGLIRSWYTLLSVAVLLALSLFIRILCLDYITLDYTNFLAKWVDFFRLNNGFAALNQSVGNYNVPYLYFLSAFSYINISDLYLIKLLTIFFDLILAYYAMRIVGIFTENRIKKLISFFLVLNLPTVILNGALWGQCDSIYTAFAVMSIYFALVDKPVQSVVAIAFAFAFKLQAIFIIPLFLVFLMSKKIKFYHLAVFPITYVIIVLPAIIFGRPFWDTLSLYFNQAESIGSGLNYNSPSIFSFITLQNTDLAAKLGIIAAFAFIILLYIILYLHREKLSNKLLLTAALLFVIGIPFFLPHMHDRYFFMADVLSVIFAVVTVKYFSVPVLVSFASLLGYHAYLIGRYLLPMKYGAVALILSLFILLFALIHDRQNSIDQQSQ